MWFKQVQLFELATHLDYQPETLAEQLQVLALQPCLPSLPMTLGWVSPLDQDEAPLVYAADGYMMVCLGVTEKVLPAAVVNQALAEQIKMMEARDNRPVGRKQRQSLKDEVTQTLLPKAFSKLTRIYACIDTRQQTLWLATASARYADHFCLAWQKVMAGVGLAKPELVNVGAKLSHWLKHNSQPKAFDIEKNAVLQDAQQQGRVIRCQQQDLFASSIQALLKDGCEVRQLALAWQQRINFVLDEQLQLRSVTFNDEVIERQQDPLSETPELRMASDFTLLTANLTELYADLLDCFAKPKVEASKVEAAIAEVA